MSQPSNNRRQSAQSAQAANIMNRLANIAFPGYQAHSAKLQSLASSSARHDVYQQAKGSEVISSLPLQVLLFFNLSYCLFWFVGMAVTVAYKISRGNASPLYTYGTFALLGVALLADLYRLRMGYSGNLMERVPELSGLIILTLFPLLVVCAYFLALQRLFTDTLPLEYCLNGFYAAMLLAELIFGWNVARAIISAQAQSFFLTMQQFGDDDEDDQQAKQKEAGKLVTHDGESLLYPDRSIRSLNIRSSRVLDVQ